MRLPFWRTVLLGGLSAYALTLRMAGGFNKRAVDFTHSFTHPTKGTVHVA